MTRFFSGPSHRSILATGLLVCGVACSLLIAGCRSAPEPERPAVTEPSTPAQPGSGEDTHHADLVGTTWRLRTLDGQPVRELTSGVHPTISFLPQENRFAARVGVNWMSGTYAVGASQADGAGGRSGTLTIGPNLMSTRMAGPPELMAQDDLFGRIVPTITSYRLRGQTLELLAADRPVATLSKAVKPADE